LTALSSCSRSRSARPPLGSDALRPCESVTSPTRIADFAREEPAAMKPVSMQDTRPASVRPRRACCSIYAACLRSFATSSGRGEQKTRVSRGNGHGAPRRRPLGAAQAPLRAQGLRPTATALVERPMRRYLNVKPGRRARRRDHGSSGERGGESGPRCEQARGSGAEPGPGRRASGPRAQRVSATPAAHARSRVTP
jgi:hypothetical protein